MESKSAKFRPRVSTKGSTGPNGISPVGIREVTLSVCLVDLSGVGTGSLRVTVQR